MPIPELLSPAGNLEKLKIALAYGADALYGSVSHFSLRNRAGRDFTPSSFAEAIEYTHKRGKKFYITINGFPFNAQIPLLREHIKAMRELKPDAFIVATIGVMRLCKEIAPEVPLHISTQANILNSLDARAFYELGATRIVAAREMSLGDIAAIKEELSDLEIEIFVHGSMCFAFSGRCLLSALQNGRTPNRGSCANDCRFSYKYYVEDENSGALLRVEESEGLGSHIFNAKDLNLSSYMQEVLQSGVISALKIEGRTKSPYYTAIATRTYRKIIDDFSTNAPFDLDYYSAELDTLKNRGYTTGYLKSRPFMRLDTQNHKTAISNGSHEVSGRVDESGEFWRCNYTTRLGEEHELIMPLGVEIAASDSEIGSIFKRNGRYFIKFKQLICEDGTSLSAIHSGNTHLVKTPARLPAFSFFRKRELK